MSAVRRCLVIVALVVTTLFGVVSTPAPPVGANASYVQRTIGQWSYQYRVNGCRFRVYYVNYGSIPVAYGRFFDLACTNILVGVFWDDGNGQQATWVGPNAPFTSGTDYCGDYISIQAVAPGPAYAVGVGVIAAGTSTLFRYDGTKPLSIHSYCL